MQYFRALSFGFSAIATLWAASPAEAANQYAYFHLPLTLVTNNTVSVDDPYGKVDVFFDGTCKTNVIDVRVVTQLPLRGTQAEKSKLTSIGKHVADRRVEACKNKNPVPATFNVSAREKDFNAPAAYMLSLDMNGVPLDALSTSMPTTTSSNASTAKKTPRSIPPERTSSLGFPVTEDGFEGPVIAYNNVPMIYFGSIASPESIDDPDLYGEIYVTQSCAYSSQEIHFMAKGPRVAKSFYRNRMEETAENLGEMMRMRCNNATFPITAYAHRDQLKNKPLFAWADTEGFAAVSRRQDNMTRYQKGEAVVTGAVVGLIQFCLENPQHPTCKSQSGGGSTVTYRDDSQKSLLDEPAVQDGMIDKMFGH